MPEPTPGTPPDHRDLVDALSAILAELGDVVPELTDRRMTSWGIGSTLFPGLLASVGIGCRGDRPFEVLRLVAEHCGGGEIRPDHAYESLGVTYQTHQLTTTRRGVPLRVVVSVPVAAPVSGVAS